MPVTTKSPFNQFSDYSPTLLWQCDSDNRLKVKNTTFIMQHDTLIFTTPLEILLIVNAV